MGDIDAPTSVVFHVLYFDENDKTQNPDAEIIYSMLEKTNQIYREAGKSSADLKVEFYPAPYDPKGRKLAESGIERVQWISPTLDAQEVMHNRKREYVHLMWEPMTIQTYCFIISAMQIFWASPHSPYCLKHIRCMVLNR